MKKLYCFLPLFLLISPIQADFYDEILEHAIPQKDLIERISKTDKETAISDYNFHCRSVEFYVMIAKNNYNFNYDHELMSKLIQIQVFHRDMLRMYLDHLYNNHWFPIEN